MHHALLELAIFGEFGLQSADLGIHVVQGFGDGFLFGFRGRDGKRESADQFGV